MCSLTGSHQAPPPTPAELPRGERHLSLHVMRYPRGPKAQTWGTFKGWVWTEAFPGHSGWESGPASMKRGTREVCAARRGTMSRPAFTCCPPARQLREMNEPELGQRRSWEAGCSPWGRGRPTPCQTNPLECGRDSGQNLWVQDPQHPNADAPRRGALADSPLRLCLSRAWFPQDGPPVLSAV